MLAFDDREGCRFLVDRGLAGERCVVAKFLLRELAPFSAPGLVT